MLGKLSGLRSRGFNRGSSQLLENSLTALPAKLESLVSKGDEHELASLSKEFSDISGLNELSLSAADLELIARSRKELDVELFKDILSRPDYALRLEPLVSLANIIGQGFDDVTNSNRIGWLSATCVTFPLSVYSAYATLAGEEANGGALPSEPIVTVRKIMPGMLYALSKEELNGLKTEKEDQDRERVARVGEGLRTISPSLRDLAFSKTRKDLSLTGIKNLYSKTFGEVFATSVVTVPSNSAPTLTYGVEKRAQLLFVIEYCARNLGNALRILEEYQLLSGRSPLVNKSVIPNPSVFLAILRREMSRLKNIEKAIAESESKLNNQVFIYYTEAGRPLSRLPLKTRPQMVGFLKTVKRRIDESHSSFQVDEIPASLREELVEFLTVTK